MNAPTNVILRLTSSDTDQTRLQSITRELTQSLKTIKDVTASTATGQPAAGTKGDAVLIGNIIMALIGSGGVAVSLVHVLKAYIERKTSLHFELERADGNKLVVNAENLAEKQIKETTRMVATFLKG